MKYTNPRMLLDVSEVDLYDVMLRTSTILPEIAKDGLKELQEMIVDGTEGVIDQEVNPDTVAALHRMLTYAFTLGVSFAVARQVDVATAQLKKAIRTVKN